MEELNLILKICNQSVDLLLHNSYTNELVLTIVILIENGLFSLKKKLIL